MLICTNPIDVQYNCALDSNMRRSRQVPQPISSQLGNLTNHAPVLFAIFMCAFSPM